jgi:dephospho-CoA kinase
MLISGVVAWVASDLPVSPVHSSKNHPYTVALTGGIASGKTLVSDEFARLDVPVIDTDVIAHRIVEPGQPALKEIENAFSPEIIDKDGRLKRQALRNLIFSNPDKRKELESILHPRIRQEAGKAIAEVTFAYCILVIPLLVERDNYPNLDRILVVDVEPATQISRLMARDSSTRAQARQALASQARREQRLKIADDVLDNSGSPEQAKNAVAKLHKKYKRLASMK